MTINNTGPSGRFYKFSNDPPNIKWSVTSSGKPVAYCETHLIPLSIDWENSNGESIFCPVDPNEYTRLQNSYEDQQEVVKHLVNRDNLKDMETVNIDVDGYTTIAKEKKKLLKEYWIETKVYDSSNGVQAMIQIGKTNGSGEKVQLFVDSPRKRLGFDISNKDVHPSGILSEVTAVFKDSVTIIKENKDE